MGTSPFETEQSGRPKFLKVLCILTFVGVGLVLLLSTFGVNSAFFTSAEDKAITREQTVEQVLKMNPEADEELVYSVLMDSEKYEASNLISGALCALISLAGALMMWKMQKTGFYIYMVGELLGYVITLVMHGMEGMNAGIKAASIWGSFSENLAIGSMVLVILFDVAFIVMYAMNLKHLS